ncbi:MAG: STAS/SEC14 domain-containing protein [Gemmatimonadetes bacterium]|nr:MAG: STAS/SEC14 domain-containing protein [Gemmatimonadota bacterium]
MAVDVQFLTPGELVLILVSGAPTIEEVRTAILRVLHDARYRKGMSVLWDLRGMERAIPTDQLQEFLGTAGWIEPLRGGGRTAIVASEPLAYGIGRMATTILEGVISTQFQVFDDLEQAYAWLGLPPDAEGLTGG